MSESVLGRTPSGVKREAIRLFVMGEIKGKIATVQECKDKGLLPIKGPLQYRQIQTAACAKLCSVLIALVQAASFHPHSGVSCCKLARIHRRNRGKLWQS